MKKGDEILIVDGVWEARVFSTIIVQARITRLSAPYLWCGAGYRFSIYDRGITWCPAWREKEAAAFRVQHALGVT